MAAGTPFSIDAAEPDFHELAAFYSSQTGEAAEAIYPRLAWQARNPSRRPDIPLVLCARLRSGAIAGAMLCIPHRLLRQSHQYTALMSSGFYVDQSIRGAGIHIFLQYRALSARYVLYATTANQQTVRLWRSAGGTPLARTGYELLRPIRWSSVIEEMLVRRFGRRTAPLARLVAPLGRLRPLGARGSGAALQAIDRPEDGAAPAAAPRDDDDDDGGGLRPVRDAAFVGWRFFDVPQADGCVYRYRNAALGADGFVAVTHSRRGYRLQLRTVYLADMWGAIPPEAFPALLDAIGDRHRQTADLIAVRCVREPYERQALAAGCVRRDFEYPIGWLVDHAGVLGRDGVLMPPAATELV
jgi:hypothetical protein